MKTVLLLFGLLTTLIVKKKNTEDHFSQINKNVEDYYTIEYKKYENLNTSFVLTEREQMIVDEFKKIKGYTYRITGGWVKDKLINDEPRDVDITVNTMSFEKLLKAHALVFTNLKQKYDISNSTLFRPTHESRGYGFTKITLFGQNVDSEVLAKKRKALEPEYFIPTQNLTEDALIRDYTIDAMYYNINTEKIEDPLERGMEDLKRGVLAHVMENPVYLKNDFLYFRLMRISAQFSMRIDDKVSKIIKDNIADIKRFLFENYDQTIQNNFSRIAIIKESLKAFKLLYDYDLIEPLIPKEHKERFLSDKIGYMNMIFNHALIFEVSSQEFFKYSLENKFNFYMELLKSPFEESKVNMLSSNTMFTVSKTYCEEFNCKENILRDINIPKVRSILITQVLK